MGREMGAGGEGVGGEGEGKGEGEGEVGEEAEKGMVLLTEFPCTGVSF